MPHYRVTGDIVTGAFVHVIEATSDVAAAAAVEALSTDALHTVSDERARPRVDSVEAMADGEDM